MNELLAKCSDLATELHPRKKTPDDKTIREAVKTYALDKAAGFSSGKSLRKLPGKSPGK
jgi:hypothetical protein